MENDNEKYSVDRIAITLFVLAGLISMIAVYMSVEGKTYADQRDSFTLHIGSTSIFVVFIIKNVTKKQGMRNSRTASIRWILMILSFFLVLAGYYLLSVAKETSLAVKFAWFANVLMVIAALMAYFGVSKQTGGTHEID